MASVETLQKQFAIAGSAKIISGQGGLPAVQIDNGQTEALIYLLGGHVALWRPKGQDEVLWMSEKSVFANGKAIRGGVPICFPWFGPKMLDAQTPDKTAPGHGFVRLVEWTLEAVTTTTSGEVTVVLSTASTEETQKAWKADFVLRHRITVGRTLTMALELTNTGQAGLTAQEALHTYYSVGDVKQVKITGLENAEYLDKMEGGKRKTQEGAIAIAGETDRVYLKTNSTVVIHDPVKCRRILIAKENSEATVVWNPWINKSKTMADFGDNEWPGMVCVETCNVGEAAVTVEAGGTHVMTARISVEKI